MTWLDILVLVICIAAFVRGLKTGFVMQVASLAAIVLGAIFAGKLAKIIYPHLHGIIDNSENIARPISYLVAFILILVVINIIGKSISYLVETILLGPINRVFGAAFCMGKWILIVSIFLNLAIQFDHSKSILKEKVRDESHTFPILTHISQTVIPYLRFDDFTPPANVDASFLQTASSSLPLGVCFCNNATKNDD